MPVSEGQGSEANVRERPGVLPFLWQLLCDFLMSPVFLITLAVVGLIFFFSESLHIPRDLFWQEFWYFPIFDYIIQIYTFDFVVIVLFTFLALGGLVFWGGQRYFSGNERINRHPKLAIFVRCIPWVLVNARETAWLIPAGQGANGAAENVNQHRGAGRALAGLYGYYVGNLVVVSLAALLILMVILSLFVTFDELKYNTMLLVGVILFYVCVSFAMGVWIGVDRYNYEITKESSSDIARWDFWDSFLSFSGSVLKSIALLLLCSLLVRSNFIEIIYGLVEESFSGRLFFGVIILLLLIYLASVGIPIIVSWIVGIEIVGRMLIQLGQDPVLSIASVLMAICACQAVPKWKIVSLYCLFGNAKSVPMDSKANTIDTVMLRIEECINLFKIVKNTTKETRNKNMITGVHKIKKYMISIWKYFLSIMEILIQNAKLIWPLYVITIALFFFGSDGRKALVFEGGWDSYVPFHLQFVFATILVTLGIQRLTSANRSGRPIWWLARMLLVLSGLAFMLDKTEIFGLDQSFMLVVGSLFLLLAVVHWWILSDEGEESPAAGEPTPTAAQSDAPMQGD